MEKTKTKKGRCPNCGEILDVDIAKRTKQCPNCQFDFAVKDAISAYTIYEKTQKNNNNKQNLIENFNIDKTLQEAEYELKLNNFAKAMTLFEDVLEHDSTNAQAWFGLVKCQTKRFTDYEEDTHEEELYKALSFASDTDKAKMLQMYDNYINARELYQTKKTELNASRVEMFKGARTIKLQDQKQKLEETFTYKNKLEIINVVFITILIALAFMISIVFGGITVFASSFGTLKKVISFFGIITLFGAMAYFLYTKYNFVSVSKILFNQILNQEELVDNLAQSINKPKKITIELLNKMYNKGYLSGFSLYENKYVLIDLDTLSIAKSKLNPQKPKTSKTNKNDKKLKKIDNILNKKK